MLFIEMFCEALYPTLGDDADVVAIAAPTEPMHPGYRGAKVLDAPISMPPDGLCLYHCIVAAIDKANYLALSPKQRAVRAEELRSATIAKLREHGLAARVDRLGLSGYDGYPDE